MSNRELISLTFLSVSEESLKGHIGEARAVVFVVKEYSLIAYFLISEKE